jgi:hypothetical protein
LSLQENWSARPASTLIGPRVIRPAAALFGPHSLSAAASIPGKHPHHRPQTADNGKVIADPLSSIFV